MGPGALTTTIALTIIAVVAAFVGGVIYYRRRQPKQLKGDAEEKSAFATAWETETPFLNPWEHGIGHAERQASDSIEASSSSTRQVPLAPVQLCPNRLGDVFWSTKVQSPTSEQPPQLHISSPPHNEDISRQSRPLTHVYRSASGYFRVGSARAPRTHTRDLSETNGLEQQVPRLRMPLPEVRTGQRPPSLSPGASTPMLTRNPFRTGRWTSPADPALEELEETLAFTPTTSDRSSSFKAHGWWPNLLADRSPWSSVLNAVMYAPRPVGSPELLVRDPDAFHGSPTLRRAVSAEERASYAKVHRNVSGGSVDSVGQVRPLPTPPRSMLPPSRTLSLSPGLLPPPPTLPPSPSVQAPNA